MNNKMKKIIDEIARKHFRIESLEKRNRDSLDFYDVAVWSIEQALTEAYQTGFKNGAHHMHNEMSEGL